MTDDAEIPESMEQRVEAVRRGAAALDDFRLDEHLACAVARRNVAAAHRRDSAAETWNEVAVALDDVRRARTQVAREVEELTGPSAAIIRPLTREELAEFDWPEEAS